MHTRSLVRLAAVCLLAGAVTVPAVAPAQDRLRAMPRYDRYERMRREIAGSVKRPLSAVTWADDGKKFEYEKGGKRYRYDIAARKASEIAGIADCGLRIADCKTAAPYQEAPSSLGARGAASDAIRNPQSAIRNLAGPRLQARGRQVESALSPDGKLRAVYRDRNLYVTDPDGGHEVAVTTDGSEKARVKNGTASWVYGEELGQRTAFWWSPDSRKLAYYRFDESKVPDYFLQMKNLQVHDALDVEPYPKPGDPNPVVGLYVYDLGTKQSTRVDVRDGKPFDNQVVGHYVYDIAWTKDGSELLFHRSNRRQNVMEIAAADPATGKCRVVVREEWPSSWTENRPTLRWLDDGKRFILASERTGWRNYYLYDLSGKLLATLTNLAADAEQIVRVDEKAGRFYYTARDGDNPMKLQLHRVGLDGTGDTRLTDPAFTHAVDLAPDGQHFIDVAQTHDTPPVTRLVDADGRFLDELDRSDTSKFDALGLKKTELFTYKAADGKTELYGSIQKPSDFDPAKKYPVLISVYGGPETAGVSENFRTPSPFTELGFLVVSLDGRNSSGRGKRFLDALYEHLGTVEIDDAAEGVKALRQRPYVDGGRVGIEGTSYGGYFSAMALLRHPDVFQAACACSPPTDWRLYDSIYTERYMWLPDENKAGYDAGSAMTYAKDLRGRLLLYFGTADNNVHPANSLQLIAALQRAGKSFEVQVGPDRGHSAVPQDRMLEFFVGNLIVHPESLLAPEAH